MPESQHVIVVQRASPIVVSAQRAAVIAPRRQAGPVVFALGGRDANLDVALSTRASEATLATRSTEATLLEVRDRILTQAQYDAKADITTSALRDGIKGGKTLADIWTSLQTQREISTSLWTDNSGAVYVRRDIIDESTGTATIQFTDAAGVVVTPGVGLRPLASADKEVVESTYTAIAAGSGYAIGDIVARVLILDTSVAPPGLSTTWMNVTAGTIIAAPTPAHIDQFVGLTDQELRASPLPNVDVPLSTRAAEATLAARNNSFATLLNYLPDTTGKEMRRDETATDDYHGRAPDGTATSAASWEVVRFYKDTLGNVTRVRYRTGVVWDNRSTGW